MRTPKRNYIADIVFIFAIILAFTACEDPSNNRGNKEGETTFTVRFNRNGGRGTVPGPITVSAGSSITLPDGDGLSKSGYVFGGWNTEADGEGTYYDEGESFTPAGNVTLYAHWDEVVTYTVTFNSNGGSNVEAQIVSSDGTATRPADPAKSGYTFDNWYSNVGLTTVYNFSTPVMGDIILHAKWIPVVTYTVTFNSNGGSNVATQTVNSGGTATRPANPIQSGYTFDNWYSESLTTVYNFSTPVTGNITLYAKWTPVVTYTVSFDSNGATGGTAPLAQTAAAGSSITLPSGSWLSRSGYAFGGWNTQANGAGINHSADSSYTVQNNITLYADWIIVPVNSFTVTFDSNGGSSVDIKIVQSGGTVTRPATPARSGYTFGNWYSNAGLTAVYNFSTPVTGNIILYAKWNINRYIVTFNADGGTPAPVQQTVDHGGKVNEPAAMTKANYTFGGWFKESALINQWNFVTDTVTEDTDLYAKWTLNQYTVTFNANSGSGTAPTAQTVAAGSSITLPSGSGLSRTGYTFGGWNTQADGAGTNYNAESSYTPTGTVTLYARWVYTVTFSVNGGSGTTPSAQSVSPDSSITLPSGSGLSRTGYTFGGWNTNNSGTGTNYEAGSSYAVTGNVTLYAKWIATYTITFNANTGSGTVPTAQTVTAGSSITLPNGSGLTRTGYTFDGWNTNESGTGTNYNAGGSYTVTGTIALYAKWIEVEVVVSTTGVELVRVAGGSFEMGNPDASVGDSDERPVHTVTLSAFYMGKYEVTQAQYRTVMGNNPSSSYGVGDNYPVYYVSWYDALVFCNKLSIAEGLTPAYRISNSTDPTDWGTVPTTGSNSTWNAVTIDNGSTGYRLPTEAQWEYAARGGNGSPGNYIYSGSNTVGDVAWYSSNSGSKTHEVGTKAPNGLGLYDMSGNVWEWCWDWYASYSSRAQTDPLGASSGSYRVRRGGLWDASAGYVRSAYRNGNYPFNRSYHMGFRLARPE